jgi:hypothetical protein
VPEPAPGTCFVVSLVVGLAAAHRTDLLVAHAYVRDLDGCIIGSGKLVRPARHPDSPERAGIPGRRGDRCGTGRGRRHPAVSTALRAAFLARQRSAPPRRPVPVTSTV